MDWQSHLLKLGMIRGVSGGIQLDITAALKRTEQGYTHGNLCDHNCTAEAGHYTCPAAFTLNRDVDPKSLAPAELLMKSLEAAIPAVKGANSSFLETEFRQYCNEFRVPDEVASVLAETIRDSPVEINITGGNPELHPDIIDILAWLNKYEDAVVNLTTTGRKFMLDAGFREKIMDVPPAVLSFSADAFRSAGEIVELASKTPNELYQVWQQVPRTNGQAQKALEAVFIANKLKGVNPPHAGFNLVVHPGNIDQVEDIIKTLAEVFPENHIFAYPAQTGYLGKPGVFSDLELFETFVNRMIEAHFQGNLAVTPRLQYWLILKSAFNVFRKDKEKIADLICGRGLWFCYKKNGGIRYLQIGKGTASAKSRTGGGHLGCFWNSTTIAWEEKQVWEMDSASVAAYILGGARAVSRESQSPCSGCGFPRLLFDVVTTETGLNELLVADYLKLRKEYAGY